MKLLFDFFPIIIFFAVYKFYGIYAATTSAIIVSLIQVIVHRIRHKKFDNMQLATLIIIAVMGGATLIFHNEIFIKWKPTIINWVFAFGFWITHFFGDKVLTQRMLEKNIVLKDRIWRRLNLSWVTFFIIMGAVNLYVIYHFSTDAWVNFKLFGMLGLTVIFVILQTTYLLRHVDPAELERLQQKDKEGK